MGGREYTLLGQNQPGAAASLAGYHRYNFENLLASLNIPISLLDEEDATAELAQLSEI